MQSFKTILSDLRKRKGLYVLAAVLTFLLITGLFSACMSLDEPTQAATEEAFDRALVQDDETQTPTAETTSETVTDAEPDTSEAPAETEPASDAEPGSSAPSAEPPSTQKPTEAPTEPTTAAEHDYVVNTNTKKFHYPTCSSVGKIKPSNRSDRHCSRDVLIAEGYDPCGNCRP